jgi:hypothetical protein
MATLSNVNEVISTATGIELGQIKLLSRMLREARLIPQTGRGLHAAHLEAFHIATLFLGLLVARHVGPLHRVASMVRQVGALRKKDAVAIRPYPDSPQSVELLPPDTTFLEALGRVISAFSQNETPASFHGAVTRVGIRFGVGRAYPWIEFKRGRGFNGLTNEPDRLCAFGSASLLHRVQTAGMVSESKISNGVLLEVAQLLRKDANSIAGYIEHLKEKHIRKK